MVTLDRTEIERVWIDAGGDPEHATMAAAVALGESNGAVDSVSADGRRGLWMGPVHAAYAGEDMLDPTWAAREAIARSNNGRDWSHFGAYKHGAHLQFLPGRGRVPISTAGYTGKWSGVIQINRRYIRVEYRRISGASEVTIMTGRARHYPPE